MARLSHQLVSRIRELVGVASGDAGSAAAAAELAALRDRLSVLDLPGLDLQLRRAGFLGDDWQEIVPADLRRVAALHHGSAVVQVLTCHPSGYVREAAVRALAVVSDGGEVGFLLLRLNDWVAPVRRAAAAALRARARADLAPALLRALPLLDRMRSWGRIDERELLDQLDATLGRAELIAGLSAPEVPTRRICARRLVAMTPDAAAIERGLADRDAVVRRQFSRWLCGEAGPRFDEHVGRLLRDRSSTIRREALFVAVERGVSAETFLVDVDPGVRGLARARLVAAGDDVAARYHAMLAHASPAIRVIGLTGLAETAGGAAADAVRGALADREPRMRAAALTAAAALRFPDLLDLLVAALADPAPAPRRAARGLLVTRAARVRPAAVWSVFTAAPRGIGQRAALVVLARCDYWTRLPYLLRASADPDPAIARLAETFVSTWVDRRSRVFTSPAAKDVTAIRDALAMARIGDRLAAQVATAVATPATSSS